MSILNAVMVPHPPLIIPEVGRGQEKEIQATVNAYREAAQFVARARPDVIAVATPHSVLYADWFHISPGAGARGSFAPYRAEGVRLEARYDEEFVHALCRLARDSHFPAGIKGQKDPALDHATMIPLYFLREAYGVEPLPPIVRVGLSALPTEAHYRFGMLLAEAAEALGRRLSVVASGDLSHRLKEDGPYGFRAEGPRYDARIMDVMGRAAFDELFDFSEALLEAAGECGHRAFAILAGALDGVETRGNALSYEGSFGVGYGVCLFEAGEEDASRRFLDRATAREKERLRARKAGEDAYVRLARLSVETFVTSGRRASLPAGLPEEMQNRRAGVFVSLHKRGQLRGCIGTTSACTASVAEEILQNGVSACAEDPRFSPVTTEELPLLEYSVDVLGAAEAIDGPAQLDAQRYGVIVTSGRRRGLLLPALEGVNTPEEQIAIARRKAGIGSGESVRLQRFEVVRHE